MIGQKSTKLAVIILSLGLLIATEMVSADNVCTDSGEYAVFAQHPLFEGAWALKSATDEFCSNAGGIHDPKLGICILNSISQDRLNTELSHEHVFFCKDGKIEDNIGFGPSKEWVAKWFEGARFYYPEPPSDFVVIDKNKYNSKMIKEILGLGDKSCKVPKDGKYMGLWDNCQGFTERVRNDYIKKLNDAMRANSKNYGVLKESTAPKGCWCAGPKATTIISNTKATNNEPGGHERDGITVELSNPVDGFIIPGFQGFENKMSFFSTKKTYCVDPECGRGKGVTNYVITETVVKRQ